MNMHLAIVVSATLKTQNIKYKKITITDCHIVQEFVWFPHTKKPLGKDNDVIEIK